MVQSAHAHNVHGSKALGVPLHRHRTATEKIGGKRRKEKKEGEGKEVEEKERLGKAPTDQLGLIGTPECMSFDFSLTRHQRHNTHEIRVNTALIYTLQPNKTQTLGNWGL